MTGDIDSLVALRKSSADFAEWRTRLGEAMSYVGDFPDDEQSLFEASRVVKVIVFAPLSYIVRSCELLPTGSTPAPSR